MKKGAFLYHDTNNNFVFANTLNISLHNKSFARKKNMYQHPLNSYTAVPAYNGFLSASALTLDESTNPTNKVSQIVHDTTLVNQSKTSGTLLPGNTGELSDNSSRYSGLMYSSFDQQPEKANEQSDFGKAATLFQQKRQNGRIDISPMRQPDYKIWFSMQEQLPLKSSGNNKEYAFYKEAIVGRQEGSLLAFVFFSGQNMQIIKNAVRAGVYNMSGQKFTCKPLDDTALFQLMYQVYYDNGEHHSLKDPSFTRNEVERLNEIIISYCVPHLYSMCVSHIKFLEDVSTLPSPIDRPVQTDRNFKTLDQTNQIGF